MYEQQQTGLPKDVLESFYQACNMSKEERQSTRWISCSEYISPRDTSEDWEMITRHIWRVATNKRTYLFWQGFTNEHQYSEVYTWQEDTVQEVKDFAFRWLLHYYGLPEAMQSNIQLVAYGPPEITRSEDEHKVIFIVQSRKKIGITLIISELDHELVVVGFSESEIRS